MVVDRLCVTCGQPCSATPECQDPQCLTCIRAEHGLTETPADIFRKTPPEVRRQRYSLPLGSPAKHLC